MGTADRVIRMVIAVLIFTLYTTGTISGLLGIILLILGGVFILTSFVRICPLYSLFGINTCSVQDTEAQH
jgi:hypothetical protein